MDSDPNSPHGLGNALKRWFWRDPDPIWRWASGQSVRWWRHPLAVPALAAATLTAILALALVLSTHGPVQSPSSWTWEWGAAASGIIVLVVYTCMFIVVARRPFDIFGRLGGPPMLRQILLSRMSCREIGRCLYWGSYRSAALPALALLYYLEMLFFTFVIVGGPYMDMGFLPRSGLGVGLLGVLMIAKPPLDHAMNLAIAWRFYFHVGRKTLASVLTALLLVVVFPLGPWSVLKLVVTAEALYAESHSLPVPSLMRELFIQLAYRPYVPAACALAFKAWFARRCYTKFLAEWDTDLANRFGDAA